MTHGRGSNGDDHPPLATRATLEHHMDAIHEAASELLLASLLPAIEVAWADGVIQDRERERILEFTVDSGLSGDTEAMQRVHRWLEHPPTKQEYRETLSRLQSMDQAEAQAALAEIIEQAHAVAQADGGVLGIGSVNADERRALGWLEMVLESRWEDPHARPKGLSPMLDVLGLFWEMLVDLAKADTVHHDVVPPGEHDMWPQPSPWGAENFAPAVLGVPEAEYREYMDVIVGRYLRSLKEAWWDAICHAAMRPGIAPMSDEDLGAMLHGAPFGRFVCPTLDPQDHASFGELIAEARALGAPHKVDMRHLARCEPLPEMYLAPTVGLFALRDDQTLVPLALEVNGHLFRPGDGESWERARYFMVQSCAVSMVLGAHPHLHFPMDSVIGVAREVTPSDHPLRQVIEAHAWLHLPLDYGVSFNSRSVAHNHQSEIYTPFPVRRDDVFRKIVSAFYVGTPGNSARPGYRYPMAAPEFPGRYAEFLRRYWDVVLEFCRRVAATIADDDPVVAAWGGPLHELIPGFPSVAQLRDPEILARALCGFVHTVSIWHSADHHTFGEWPVNKLPQRLRVPPPTGDDEPVPLDRWVRGIDIVRQELARQLFYQAHTVRGILEVDYGFEQPELEQAAEQLREELRRCDREQPVRYIPLEQIACSLQF